MRTKSTLMSGEASSESSRYLGSTRKRAFQIEHVDAALEHGHERAHLVVRRHQFAGLVLGAQRDFVLARRLRHGGQFDRFGLAIGRGLELLAGDRLHFSGGCLHQQLHRNVLPGETVDAHRAVARSARFSRRPSD